MHSQEHLLSELLHRKQARRSLMEFTRYTNPNYAPALCHTRIVEALDAVARGEITRLQISAPPRAGKSELFSRRFPAYMLGRRPGIEIIASSYSGDLAADFGREVRQIVRDAEFRNLFPDCNVSASSGAVERWETTTGGKYRAVGVEGSATGRGADLLIIDDPVKDQKEADSETTQRRTWEWFQSTAYTRLSKNAAIVVGQTRWNDNDLSGLLLELEKQGGEKWHQVIIPALDEKGESFWPDRFPLDRLAAIRKMVGERKFSALYMQKPQPPEGTFFQRAWFERAQYDNVPDNLHIYMTSDHARTDDAGDFTVLRIWGVDEKADLYWLDGWRGQKTPDQWAKEAISLIRTYKPLCWFAENDTIWGSVAPFVRRVMRDSGVACRIETLSTRGDKVAKAQSFQGMAAQGRVHLPRTIEANAALDEYIRFPAGKNDDEVDCGSNIGRALMDAHPAIVARTPTKPANLDPWGRVRQTENDWRVA